MPTSAGYKVLRAIGSQTSAESAPTTSTSGWFAPDQFPGADGLEFALSTVTKGSADVAAPIQIWLKQTVAGSATVVPYGTMSVVSGSTTVAAKQFANVPPGDWYATVGTITGTTSSVAATMYVRPYKTPT